MKLVTALTFVIAAALAVGCDSTTKTASVPSDVLNVSPTPAAMPSATPSAVAMQQPMMAQQPISDTQQVAFSQPIASQSMVTDASTSGSASSGAKSYTVKKGDTLFGIAKTQLGSGRDWQKIAAANPGLTPQKLRVGQKIVIPS